MTKVLENTLAVAPENQLCFKLDETTCDEFYFSCQKVLLMAPKYDWDSKRKVV
jgi:hypothetical protein